MALDPSPQEIPEHDGPLSACEAGIEPPDVSPWEQIESGRFRPLRIRGSYHGRELG